MRVYRAQGTHLLCGHWNGSPEIGLTGLLRRAPPREAYHHHPYREYFVVLEGRGRLLVEGEVHEVESGAAVMVEPGEAHRWDWVDPDAGIRWVLVKERSEPDSKTVVSEP